MNLGEVCETSAGGTPLKSEKEYYAGGDIPWLLSGEVNSKNITLSKNFITRKGLDNSSAKVFPPNTVLVAMYGATAGQVGILRFHAATNQAVCGILPNDRINPEYLYYFLLSRKSTLVAQAVGNAQPNISQQKIRNTEIELPTLAEQKRIVAMLDEAFADIDKARELTEKNLKNARELFDSYLHQVFEQNEDQWIRQKLGDCFSLRSGDGLTKKNMVDGVIPVFGGNGIAGYHNEYNLTPPAVILGRVGALCGNAKYIDSKIWLTDNAFLVKNFKYEFDLEFLVLLLNLVNLRKYARQAAQPVISNSSLSQVILKFPTCVHLQKDIRQDISALNEHYKKVVSVYTKKLDCLDELKQSVLKKAFSGD